MKMKINGEIKDKLLSEGLGSRGKWLRAGFKINDKVYSTFDKKIIDEFKPGDYVEAEIKEDQFNNNILTMKVIAPTEKVAQNGSKQEFHLSIEQIRSNALICAFKHIELNGTKDLNTKNIIDIAKFYEAYIQNGD